MQSVEIHAAPVETVFPQGCGRLVSFRDGEVRMAPDTPEAVPGNGQYHFLTRVQPHRNRLTLIIEWPQRNTTDLQGFYYPGNRNFAEVLPQICFLSEDRRKWRRVENAQSTPTGVRLELEPRDEAVYVGVGLPYAAERLGELLGFLRARTDDCAVREIGFSRKGRALHGILYPPERPERCRGLFVVQAYQHHSEWAGLYALDALARGLADGSVDRGDFAWALMPCLNVDALEGGWREDLMYTATGREEKCGNFNRDWLAFGYPEVAAAARFYREAAAKWPLLHALDFHMGWHSPESSGGALSVFVDGTVGADAAERERAFAKRFFERVPIEPHSWPVTRPDRPNFASWVWREFGALAQTVEVSRFMAFDADRRPCPISRAYFESLGPLAAQALREFHQG